MMALGTCIVLSSAFARGDWLTLVQVVSTANPVVVLIQGLWYLVVDVVTPLYFVLLLVSFLWVIGATGLFLRRLVLRFSLHHRPAHAAGDESSAVLDYFALTLALVVLASVVLLGGYCLWRGFSVWSIGASLLLLALIFFLVRTCFAPVYALRQSILKERRELA
jgi:hypothetical protein